MRPACVLVSLLLTSALLLSAQPLQLTLQMNPQPSPYLSDWQTRRETVFLSITNATASMVPVRVDGKVFRDGPNGVLMARSKLQQMPILEIPPGASIYNAEDIFPSDLVEFFGDVEGQATRTGRIPAGQYTLCVTLVNPENSQPLSQQRCSPFQVQQYQPPFLVLPADGAVLTLDQLRTTMFRWNRETPPAQNAIYEVVVVEYRDGQPVWQALKANPPVYQQEVAWGVTQMQWPPDVVLPSDRQYVWSVRAVDEERRPITEPEWANPFVFSLAPGGGAFESCDCSGLSIFFGNPTEPVNDAPSLSRSTTEFSVTPIGGQAQTNKLLSFKAITNCSPSCVRAYRWTVYNVTGERTLASTPLEVLEPYADMQNIETFSFLPTEPGQYEVELTMTVAPAQVTMQREFPPRDVATTVLVPVANSVYTPPIENQQPCVLSILSPSQPCTGSMHEYHSDGSIDVLYEVSGPITELVVTVYENPCGTYDPPITPTDKDTPTVPTTSQRSTTTASTRPSATGYRAITSLPCPTASGQGSITVPVSDLVKPGGAYIIGLSGMCTRTDQEGNTATSLVEATEVCWRYRPLVEQTASDATSEDQTEGRSRSTSSESRPTDVPKVPVTEIPCDSIPTSIPCSPSAASDPATPIASTLELASPDVYPYPRAAPLRVRAEDYDYAIFQCQGCAGGLAELFTPVRDEIGTITWKLVGKGSLNTPFDGAAIQAIDNALAELLKRLAAIKDSIPLTESKRLSAIDEFKQVQADAEVQLADRKKDLEGAKDSLEVLTDKLKEVYKKLDSLGQKLDSMAQRYAALQDSVQMHQDSIARRDSLLTNPPSASEKAILVEVDATLKSLDDAQQKLQDLQEEIAETSATLQAAIKNADLALANAHVAYSNAQNTAGRKTRVISDLQGKLYNTPALEDYRQSRRDIQQHIAAFGAGYPTATDLPKISADIGTMLLSVHDALEEDTPPARTGAKKTLDSLVTVVKALLSSACSAYIDAPTRDGCSTAVADVKVTLERYHDHATVCLKSGEKLKKGIEASIRTAQTDLATAEGPLLAAAAAVEAAQKAHADALLAFATTIEGLDATRQTALAEVESSKATHGESQRRYQTVRKARDSAFAVNQPKLLEGRSEFARARDSARREIDSLGTVFIDVRTDSSETQLLLASLRSDSVHMADSISVLLAEIRRLEAILKRTEAEIAKPFDEALKKLRKDSSDVEEKLKKLRRDREFATGGVKAAEGEFAYYIPPPLELILDEASRKRFDDLKDSVAKAETTLAVSLTNKEVLQGTLSQMLAAISNSLAEIKLLEKVVGDAEDELAGIDGETADLKNDLAKQFREEYDALTKEIASATAEANTADAAYVDAVKKAAELAKELQAKADSLSKTRANLQAPQADLSKAVDEYRKRKAAVDEKTLSVADKGNELNSSSKELRGGRRQIKVADDKTRRAIAREDIASESAGRSERSKASTAVSKTEGAMTTNKAALAALGSALSADVSELVSKDDAIAKALDKWLTSFHAFSAAQRSYDVAYIRFQAAKQLIEKYRGEVNRAKARKELAEIRQENVEAPDKAVEDSDDLEAKQQERDNLKKQKDDATKQIESHKDQIAKYVAEKDKLIEDADNAIKDARDHLAKAQNDLKDFIRSQFEKPDHADTLIITVRDSVVDRWRSRDKEKEFTCVIRYNGKRIPELLCEEFTSAKPPEVRKDDKCIPDVTTEVGSPISPTEPRIAKPEPRTIALLYRDGEPLWKEWPVFRDAALLAKDVVVLEGVATDADLFVHACKPLVPNCLPPPISKPPVVDIASRTWFGDGDFRHVVPISRKVLWQPTDVPKGTCFNRQLTGAEYIANEVHPDVNLKRESKQRVEPGVLIEVTDSLVGWREHEDTIVARVVTGDHKGLAGEELVFIPKLEKGKSEGWSLKGSQDNVVERTDADGYVRIPFAYGKGFADWTVRVRWVRGDTCKQDEIKITTPLHLRFHRFGKSAPTIAWDAAVKVWEGEDLDATLKKMPDVDDDKNPYGKMVHAIAGILDENRAFVNDETMNFKPVKPGFKTDPTKKETSLFGIARSQVVNVIEKQIITMKVFSKDSLKPVTRPQEVTKTYNPRGGKRFKIGDPADPFYVEMDESFDLQETVSGPGKLKIDVPNQFMKSLLDLPVTVDGVVLSADTAATEGTVSYAATGLSAKWAAFSFMISTIRITANVGCGMDGTVSHSSLESPVEFTAELGGKGEFFGEVRNLPSIEAKGFTLQQGSSIALDFHSKLPTDSPLGPEFKGIIIGQAQLEFPPEFRTKGSNIPTVLSVNNLGIGNSGLSGTVSVEGGPLTMSFAKFSISVNKLSLTFKENALDEGAIEGAFTLEKPFSGTLLTRLSFSDTWTAEFETKSSISIPSWKAVAAILPGSKLEYNPEKQVGTFTLVSVIQSDQLGRIEIKQLTFASDGTFAIKGGIKKNVTIKVLKGFDLKINTVTIEASNDDFILSIHGSFGIPGIGLDKLSGILHVKPGPEISVEFTGGAITIKKGPFTLAGEFEWKDNAFYADLSVEITNVLKGIKGVIFVGTQPTSDDDSYTFWYVGLTITTAIPLGQSGLSITSIGGGVGWNCRPPIGSERPTPENFDDISLRASVGVGNTLPPPPGKVINSEFVMVYVPGSITLGGSVWLMDQRKSIYGDGQLTIDWSPKTSVSGFVRANIGIPDNGGRVLLMRGKVDFLFASPAFKIESEYLDATLFGVLNANAQFKVTATDGFIKGKVWYDLNKEADIGVGTVKAGINLKAEGSLTYDTSPSIRVTGSLAFAGNAYLSFENSLTSFDLARANAECVATFTTTGSTFRFDAKVSAYVSVLGFGGNVDFDLGAEV